MMVFKLISILSLAGAIAIAVPARATESEDLEKQETKLDVNAAKPEYEARLKERYKLTDEQLQKLHADGLNNSQITIAAQLAKDSGKSIDDIVKMRTEKKQGWGKIARELGVYPKEIGQSIADMHRHQYENRAEERKERRENRKERSERAQERAQERAERKSGGHKG